jgi:hypothetical protein
MHLLIKYLGIEQPTLVNFKVFLDTHQKGKPTVVSNVIVREYLASVGLSPSGTPLTGVRVW